METEFAKAVGAAGNLAELAQVLATREPETMEDERLMTRLPTFGGEEPNDTHNAWSWDATHLLRQVNDSRRFALVPRDETEMR